MEQENHSKHLQGAIVLWRQSMTPPPTARPRSVLGNALRNQETIESICSSWNCHTEPNMWALGAIPHLRCPPRLRQGGCSVACWSISQPIWRVAWWVRPHLLPPSSSNRPARMTPTSLHFQPDIPDWSDWWINNLQISDTGCFDLKIGIFFHSRCQKQSDASQASGKCIKFLNRDHWDWWLGSQKEFYLGRKPT